MEPASAPHVGTVIGDRYELTRHIARGGMGDVYEGTDRLLLRPVAVKLYRAASPHDRSRFDAEVLVLAGLNHPGLVPVYDAGSVGDDAYVVLELIDGPSLATTLAEGPLPPERVAELGADLAAALAHIHANGVVHRDVTPANVVCDGDGRPRLVDFGIARLLSEPRRTAPHLAIGTAAYMAPEQVQGHEVTAAADVYSLGLVLLEALTGRKEFVGTNQEVAVARLARDPDTTLGVPGPWRSTLAAMGQREPSERPSAATLELQLRRLAAHPIPAGATVALPLPVGDATAPMRVGRTDEWGPAYVPLAAEGRTSVGRRAGLVALGAGAVAIVAVLALAGLGRDDGGPTVDGSTTTTTIPATTETTRAPSPRATTTVPAATPPGQEKDKKDKGADKKAGAQPGPVALPTVPTTAAPTTSAPAPTTTNAPPTTAAA